MNEVLVKDNSLEKRLGVNQLDNKIFVSELGVVSIVDNKGIRKDISFNNFINATSNNIKEGLSKVKYDKESNRFYLITGDKGHEIDINEQVMEDYVFNKYTKSTMLLRDLANLSEEKKKEEIVESDELKERNEIVAKAENTHEDLTPLEARIYLDYLKDLDKTNAKVVAKNVSKVSAIGGVPVATGVGLGILKGTAIVGTAAGLGPAVLVGLVGVGFTALVEEIITFIIKTYSDKRVNNDFLFQDLQDLIKETKEKIEEMKINKVKKRNIRDVDFVDRIVMPNSFTVEETGAKELTLNDHILNEINSLVNKISVLNPEDREGLLAQSKELLNNYLERSNKIINNEESGLNYNNDSMVLLRIDVCRELARLEMEISKIRERDIKTRALNNEARLLVDKIDGFDNTNNVQTKSLA